jgi:hypothetical protein
MKKFLLISLLSFTSLCHAEAFKSVELVKAKIDQVMAKVGTGDIEAGLTMLKPYTIVPTAEMDSMIGQAKLQIPAISQRFGSAVGIEFIGESKVGQSLVRLAYLQKYEKHGLRWLFLLYKGSDGWVINTFVFDDKIQELFLNVPISG